MTRTSNLDSLAGAGLDRLPLGPNARKKLPAARHVGRTQAARRCRGRARRADERLAIFEGRALIARIVRIVCAGVVLCSLALRRPAWARLQRRPRVSEAREYLAAACDVRRAKRTARIARARLPNQRRSEFERRTRSVGRSGIGRRVWRRVLPIRGRATARRDGERENENCASAIAHHHERAHQHATCHVPESGFRAHAFVECARACQALIPWNQRGRRSCHPIATADATRSSNESRRTSLV